MRKLLILFCLVSYSGWLLAQQAADTDFVIEDVRVEGLQRISAGTVFNYLPVGIGDSLTSQQSPQIIRDLFRTGFFTDVTLERDGNTLVIIVVERPSIARVDIAGNRDLKTDALRDALRQSGVYEGQVYNPSLLETVERDLTNLYFSRGKYAVRITTRVQPLPRNRMAISIDISEGASARIRRINLIGNQAFDDDELLDQFASSTSGLLTVITRTDLYSRERLEADIEALRTFYLDQGYVNFLVTSTQVTITPDRKGIFITINLSEGDQYTVRNVAIAGDLPLPIEELESLVEIEPGSVFSRTVLGDATRRLQRRLGDEGFAFAEVAPDPIIDEQAKVIDLTLRIEPNQRVYVRRINFQGNYKTQDEVLRREMRQVEGASFATSAVERSKTRLRRLSFLSDAQVDPIPVAGTDDLVDLEVEVEETPSGNLLVGAGFSQTDGLLLNASVNQENFMGTGRRLGLAVNNSSNERRYSFTFNNPYYTDSGISRGFELTYEKFDVGGKNIADYDAERAEAHVEYGIPLNEYDTFRFGIGLEYLAIDTVEDTPEEIVEELEENGDTYYMIPIALSYSRDTRNRAIFADRGSLNRIGLDLSTPGSDAEYVKLNLRHLSYYGLIRGLTVSARGDFGIGTGYDGEGDLPFFENYYAGGLTTVRGYKTNTLGPRYDNGDPSGGSVKLTFGAELIFPVPFLSEVNAVRLAAFVDGGNVFNTFNDIDVAELRYSTGLTGRWLSPFGPLTLSLALPLNKKDGDETEEFQFAFGVPF